MCIHKTIIFFLALTTCILSGLATHILKAAPTVNLGADTVACQDLILDAGNAGAIYLWSTTETTQTITVSTSGTYWVSVTDGTGTSNDTIEVEILDTSTPPTAPDTNICGAQTVEILASGNYDEYFWYDNSTGGTLLASSNPANLSVTATTTFYVEGRNYSSIYSVSQMAGFDSIMGGNFFAISNSRGLFFDAKENLLLESVAVFVNPSPTFTGTIKLYSKNNTVLNTKTVSLDQAGKNVIDLGFLVPKAEDYRLMFEGLAGGSTHIDNSSPVFPVVSPAINITAGTPNAAHYNYFYDWRVRTQDSCVSTRTPSTVTVLESPSYNLGNDTTLCDNSITFDVTQSNPSTVYTWSTGDTTPVVTYTAGPNSVEVQVSIGPCSVSDTVAFDLLTTPTSISINDTVVCSPGEVTLTASGVATDFFWFDSPTSEIPIANGQSVSFDLQDSTQLFVEGRNTSTIYTRITKAGQDSLTGGNYFNISNKRGLVFNAKEDCFLKTIDVYTQPNPLFTGTIVLEDGTGAALESKTFTSTVSGSKSVSLDFFIPKGQGYRLVLQNLSGGSVHINNVNATFPILNPIIDIIEGVAPYQTQYSYFYNWEVVYRDFCMTNRIPVNVDIIFPVNIPDYLYTCDSVTIHTESSTGSILWNNGETTPSILVDSSGIYTVMISDGASCTLFDTTEVEIATIGLPEDGILCGNTLTTNFDTTAIFLWSTGDTTDTLFVNMPGTYTVFVDEPKGCQLRDTIVITGFDAFPIVDLGPDQSECVSTTIDAGNQGLNHLWSTGDTSSSINVTASGSYWVAVSNNNGCTTTDTVGISITPIPNADFTPVVNGYTVSLVNQSDFGTWQWDFGDGESSTLSNPVHTYADTGTFVIQLIVSNECGGDTISQSVTITLPTSIQSSLLNKQVSIYPNPTNDYFWIAFDGISSGVASIKLLDPYGKSIKESSFSLSQNSKKMISVAGLSNGVYLVQIVLGDQLLLKKIILN